MEIHPEREIEVMPEPIKEPSPQVVPEKEPVAPEPERVPEKV